MKGWLSQCPWWALVAGGLAKVLALAKEACWLCLKRSSSICATALGKRPLVRTGERDLALVRSCNQSTSGGR